jgi:hypothetical protein
LATILFSNSPLQIASIHSIFHKHLKCIPNYTIILDHIGT